MSEHAFTRTTARANGWTDEQIARQVACGEWIRPFRGAYLLGTTDGLTQRITALQRLRPDATASRLTAAALLGAPLPAKYAAQIEVTVPAEAPRIRRPSVRSHRQLLTPDEVMELDGVVLTNPARTMVDVATGFLAPVAVAVIDALIRLTGVDPAELAVHVARLPKGTRGIVWAKRSVGLLDARSESPMESMLRVVMALGGLPAPEVQWVVRDGLGRFVARLDLAYPTLKIAIEYDGLDAHSTDFAFVRDRQRQNELVALGWTVLRFTSEDVLTRTGSVVDQIAAQIFRARNRARS